MIPKDDILIRAVSVAVAFGSGDRTLFFVQDCTSIFIWVLQLLAMADQ
jgi:hypothetical protein